jgi:hypothetical protein
VRAAIDAARQFLGQRFAARTKFGNGFACSTFLGKMQRQIVLAQDGKHIHAFLVGRAEHFDDFAFRIGVARFPFAQFDHHLVADIGRAGPCRAPAAHKHRAECAGRRG